MTNIYQSLEAARQAYQPTPEPPAGYRLVGAFSGWHGEQWGFVAFNESTQAALIAFRGTDPTHLPEWIADGAALLVPIPWDPQHEGGWFHYGFLGIYNASRNAITALLRPLNATSLCIVGHSLGGPLATLCAFENRQMNPTVVTFASPRPGSHKFADTFDRLVPNCTRVKNLGDIVTEIPGMLFFSHVGKVMEIRGGQDWRNPAIAHGLDSGYKLGLLP